MVDPITLDIVENALKNARLEMDAVVYSAAMSPMVREQHDEFPMITDGAGRMLVGQFGSHIPAIIDKFEHNLDPGDVILLSDPYLCAGSVSHANDWLIILPIFYEDERVGFASMFGQMMDIGGPTPGSQPCAARDIYGEGTRIPPIKLYEAGQLNRAALDILLCNSRTPEMNESDLMALIAGCRTAERRVLELCRRFGKETYKEACQALLDRTREAMRQLILKHLPTEPQVFVDYVDDDGLGNGPFKMKLTVWREGDRAFFDWTGTDPQAPGPINFKINEGLAKLFTGIYLIMSYDPQILFNEGLYHQVEVVLPQGSLVNPNFPAPVSNRLNTHTRFFDIMSGALGKRMPEIGMAAGYGTSPYFVFSGIDSSGRHFQLVELLYGGLPGRKLGDGLDGHSWWPLFTSTPAEYVESYYPLRIEKYACFRDSGGPGNHRGGTGIEKQYRFLADGLVSVNDDRHVTHPWGINGGQCGGRSDKWLVRRDGSQEKVPAKTDFLEVKAGDMFIYRTAGAGGWGDPLGRPAAAVLEDVINDLVSLESARAEYGVIIDPVSHQVDEDATRELRESIRTQRGEAPPFHFGSVSDQLRANDPEA